MYSPIWQGIFIFFFCKKMRNPNEFAYSLTIYKAGAYDETVGFNEWETIRTVFARANIDYEEWTLDSVAYTPESTLWAEDNNGRLEIAWKQVKQG